MYGLKRRLSDEIDAFVLEEEVVLPDPPAKKSRTNFEIAEKWRRREKYKEKAKYKEASHKWLFKERADSEQNSLLEPGGPLQRRKRVVLDAMVAEKVQEESAQVEKLFEGISQ